MRKVSPVFRVDVQLCDRDGRPHLIVHAGTTDMGQGMRTTFRQIAASAAGLPYECVAVAEADTAQVPDSGPTVASRTCMVVGGLVAEASADVVRALGLEPGGPDDELTARLMEHGDVRRTRIYEPPADVS